MLDEIMFENLLLFPFVNGIVMTLVSVRPWIFDVVMMSVVVKGKKV